MLRILPPVPLIINWPLVGALAVFVTLLGGLSRPAAVRRYAFLCLFLLILLGLRNQRFHRLQQAGDHQLPEKEYGDLSGTVCSQIRFGQETGTVFTILTQELHYHRKKITLPLKIQVRLAKGPLPPGLARGARITLSAELSPLRSPNNFRLPDQSLKYMAQGIDYLASCKSALLVRVDRAAPWPWRLLHSWRETLNRSIDTLPLDPDNHRLAAPLFKAVFLGTGFQGDADIHHQFTISGSLHLLAISGTHIALMVAFSSLLFFWAPSSLRRSFIAAAILLYLLTAAAPVSAQRAAIIAWAWLWASHRKRQMKPDHILGLSACLDLAVNPFIVFSAAFVLTYAICFALTYHARSLALLRGQKGGRRLAGWAGALLKTQVLALLASAPLTLHLFNQCSLNALPAGMVLIPLFALLMPISLLSLIAYTLLPATFFVSTLLLTPLLSLLRGLLHVFTYGEFLLIYRQSPPFWLLTVYLGALYLLAQKEIKKTGKGLLSIFLLSSLAFILFPDRPHRPPHPEIHVPDFGQGELHALVFPSGKSLLIDCGGSPFSDQRFDTAAVAAYLLNNRIHPQWIAISHFHADHCGTLPGLLRIFSPKTIFYSEKPRNNAFFTKAQAAGRNGLRWLPVSRGFRLSLDDTALTWLFPSEFIQNKGGSRNEHSQVIRMDSRGFSMLFCGDIGSEEEQQLIRCCRESLPCTILKVAHHGSRSASSWSFLNAVSPRLGIIHCARHNPFNFPHAEVRRRCREMQIPTWYSWQGGIIISALPGGPGLKSASGMLVAGLSMRE